MDINEAPIRVQGSKLRPMAKVIATNAIDRGTNMRVFSVLRGAGKKVKTIKDKDKDGPMVVQIEDLRKWFGKGKKGDWVRVGTDGEIKGDCARDEGEGKPKCMPRSKAHSMKKKDRASAARRKRKADPDVDRPGTGNKPIMVKTDKKESVVHEDVNVKSIDKFKAAEKDFNKNKDINFQSIADALSRIVTAVRMLDKSTSGRTDVKYEKIISKESIRINNIVNKLNYGKGGATPEGKEIVKLLNKHGLNRPFRTIIFEGVEMNEEFVVKYAKNKRGPIYQTKFKTQPEAEKFLAQKRKEGMNGIVSKAGKPVSMQKMKDLQKEEVELDERWRSGGGGHRSPFKAYSTGGSAQSTPSRRRDAKAKELSHEYETDKKLARKQKGESVEEKNVPTNPKLWAKFKSQAKAKFDVYPSAYANGWASKQYKAAGGGWKSVSESLEEKSVSKAQQKFFGMVRAKQKGEMDDASPEVKKAADSMSKKDVKDFAKTKHKGLPDKKVDETTLESIRRAMDIAKKSGGAMTPATKKIDKMKKGLSDNPRVKKALQKANEADDPCWDTHKQVGTKMKGGKQVPNCVPK